MPQGIRVTLGNLNGEVIAEGGQERAEEVVAEGPPNLLWDSDSDDEREPETMVIRNSNEHVEAMLIEIFGPEEPAEALQLL